MRKSIFILFAITAILTGCKSGMDLADGLYADIKTNKGDIVVKLEYEKTPVTVANFVSLAEGKNPFVSEEFKGKKYYDGVTFHRVMKDFMIQGGDPTATGRGSQGYKFKDEFHDSLRHTKKGILSMANGGPKTNGSQFFITHKATPWLDNVHSVFGEVVYGLDVVDSIAAVPVGAGNKPIEDVVMNSVEIIRKGKDAKKFDAVAVMTAYFEEEKVLEAKEAALKAEAKNKEAAFAKEIIEQQKKAEVLPSGLKVLILKNGDGPKPKVGQYVKVNYSGWLPNGTLFDTSETDIAKTYGKFDEINGMHRGDMSPSRMLYSPEAPLWAGFKEGLLRLKVGDKIRAFLPPHLGMGEQGGGPIPPNSNVIFDIEVMEIDK